MIYISKTPGWIGSLDLFEILVAYTVSAINNFPPLVLCSLDFFLVLVICGCVRQHAQEALLILTEQCARHVHTYVEATVGQF